MTCTIDTLRDRLQGTKGAMDNFTAKCPGHDDHANSLQVKRLDGGKLSIQCYAGCDLRDILDPLELHPRDLYPEPAKAPAKAATPKQIDCTYDYVDATGQLIFQVVRYRPKDFRQRRPDPKKPGGWAWDLNGIERPLYRLPEVLKAKAAGQPVFVVEGEKDADSLAALGLTATTNAGGAAKWSDAYTKVLQGCDLVIIPDNDLPGMKHGWRVFDAIIDATMLLLPDLTTKGDVSDWIAAGGTREELLQLVEQARSNPPERPVEAVHGDSEGKGADTSEAGDVDVDPLSELANAYRFKAQVKGTIMNCPSRGWMANTGKSWQSGEREAVIAAAGLGAVIRDEGHAKTDNPDTIKAYYSAARRAESARGVDATLRLARALPGVDATGTPWDRDEWLVNVANGTVDVRSLTLMPHERSDFLTRCIPVEYDPKAPCPTWTAHLNKVFNGDADLIRYVQFLFGYSATASMKHQLFVICYGQAGRGKSTTIEAGMHALGEYADAVSHDVVLDQQHSGHACTLAALCGLRFGLVSELPEGSRWNEAQVKRLATGDTLAARYIGQNPFSFKSTMKLWVNCNERPEFRDAGGGMARRIRCVPFNVDLTGEGRDRDVEEQLRNEAPGILRWVLEGARMAFEGEPELPEAVKVSSREYIRQNDVLSNFLDEACDVDSRNRAEVGATFEAFKSWGGDLSKKRLGTLLLTKFDQYRDGKTRYWTGFKVRL